MSQMSLSRGRYFFSLFQKTAHFHVDAPKYANRPLTTLSVLFNKAVATFKEIKSVKDRQNSTLLVDVREPQELQETGVIPGSINIPLGEIESVLKVTTPEEFQAKYGRTKPASSTEIIFSCKAGVRSAKAQETALKLGFKNVKNYEGGWLDWEEKLKNG